MDRQYVESGNLESIGYEGGILEIEFKDGSVYQYEDVPHSVFLELINADVIAQYFYYKVRQGGYYCRKIY